MEMEYLLYNIPSLVCIGISAWMAHKGKKGWGWFLFAGLLLAGYPQMK